MGKYQKKSVKQKQKQRRVAHSKSFFDCIFPGTIKFLADHYILGDSYRCVWAVREYPPATEEQAIFAHLADHSGVMLRIYNRLVEPYEQRQIANNATRKNRLKLGDNDINEAIQAEQNLLDVQQLLTNLNREKEPLLHCAVFLELKARSLDNLKILQSDIAMELTRSKLTVDHLTLRQKEGFLSVLPFGTNQFWTQYERVLPASSVANMYPFNFSGKTDPQGFYIGRDKYGTNILVDLDRRTDDKTTGSALILGNSGQGKSYLMKLLLMNLRESGKSILGLDAEGEYPGSQNEDELLLMAHTDTVRIGDIGDWEKDPLSGEIKDGKIYGRGACDDKYAIATALFIMKLLKENGYVPRKNLVFSAYSDEEYGGSHGALSTVIKYPAKRIVNMDGREGQIWHCGSGGGELKYFFHTENAVDSAKAAAKALSVVIDTIEETFAENRRREMEENPFYKGTIIPQTALRYMGTRAGNNGNDLGKGEVYFVFYTDKTKAEIDTELAQTEAILSEKLASLGIVGDGFQPATRFFHYVFCQPDSEDIKLMLEASNEATGEMPIVCGSCLSDLSVISKYGSPRTFGFGAGRDFSEEGGPHQPNEYIACDKLLAYTKTIAAYVLKVLG